MRAMISAAYHNHQILQQDTFLCDKFWVSCQPPECLSIHLDLVQLLAHGFFGLAANPIVKSYD